MTLTDDFRLYCGSVAGREHLRLGRNNQDAWAVRAGRDRIVAIVADGCSGARFSEVGARLGVEWLAARLMSDGEIAPEDVTRELARFLEKIAALVPVKPRDVIAELLLFGFLAFVIDPREALVFGMGDGVFEVNGERTVLDPGPENAPPYPAYLLLEQLPALAPKTHLRIATSELELLAIGTDGAALLGPELTGDASWPKNPQLLQRRMNVLARSRGDLHDDATAIVVRRGSEERCA
jgi:hypothetical protein